MWTHDLASGAARLREIGEPKKRPRGDRDTASGVWRNYNKKKCQKDPSQKT